VADPNGYQPEVGQRETWGSRVGFILAAAGSAIGLGNIWRFPYLTGTSGGGAFILLYLIAIAIIGYPIMIAEITIGRTTQRNPVGAFKALAPNTPWYLVGSLGVLAGFFILSYYSVVAGWSVSYVFKALFGSFAPGTDYAGAFVSHISGVWEPIIWHGIFMALTIGIIASGVVDGIQRSVSVMMPLLFCLLLLLVIRSVTLPGAMEGIAFLVKPDFSAVTARTFLDALSQAFFSLSLGMGAMITYGSYLSKKEDIGGNAAWVVGLDTMAAIIAGFAIFPAVFALGFEPSQGPGLTFITLPAVFAEMPLGKFFATIFFILLSIAALTSAISLLEVVVAWLVDEKGWSRPRASVVLGIICFIIGVPTSLGYSTLSHITFLGMDLLDTYDWVANSLMLPLGGLLIAIFTGYVWGAQKAADAANHTTGGVKVGAWWMFLIRYVAPILTGLVMLSGLMSRLGG
jgi:NSS family neurotransmitter:Na+ symporter